MGEARRRRQAGTYPEQCRPQDWCVPAGMVAITLDVVGCDPSSLAIDAADLVRVVERVASALGHVRYETVVRHIAEDFSRVRGVDARRFETLGLMALWSALHHPTCGGRMRAAVSTSLRKDGKAHVTWRFGPDELALALADGFVDLDGLAASYVASGGGGVAMVETPRDAEVMQ